MKIRAGVTYWPGLAGLWLRGHWRGLAFAVIFGLALNFALVTTFVWPQLVSRDLPGWAVPLAAWVLVLWFCVVGRRGTARILVEETAKSLQPDAVSDALLCEAQNEYLKEHWLEAESLLVRLLMRRPGDAEARLLLASVYRRGGHVQKARQQLAELARLPAAARWHEEMTQETQKLSQPKTPSQSGPENVYSPSISGPRQAA